MNNVDLSFNSDASGLLYYDLIENQKTLNVNYFVKKIESSNSLETEWKIELIFKFIISGNSCPDPECSIEGILSRGDRLRFISSEELNAPEFECCNLNPALSYELFDFLARTIFLEVSADAGTVQLYSRYLQS